MKTLKREEIDGTAYRDARHARRRIASFLEEVYNRHRLRSTVGRRWSSKPSFDASRLCSPPHRFSRHGEIYCDEDAPERTKPTCASHIGLASQ